MSAGNRTSYAMQGKRDRQHAHAPSYAAAGAAAAPTLPSTSSAMKMIPAATTTDVALPITNINQYSTLDPDRLKKMNHHQLKVSSTEPSSGSSAAASARSEDQDVNHTGIIKPLPTTAINSNRRNEPPVKSMKRASSTPFFNLHCARDKDAMPIPLDSSKVKKKVKIKHDAPTKHEQSLDRDGDCEMKSSAMVDDSDEELPIPPSELSHPSFPSSAASASASTAMVNSFSLEQAELAKLMCPDSLPERVDKPTRSDWLNPSAYIVKAQQYIGSVQRNRIRYYSDEV